MGTGIEWTDETWNAITGCTKISPGCLNCYAGFDKVVCHPDTLEIPLRWKKPRMVFVNSMSDLFHKDVPGSFVMDVLAVIEKASRHTFQVLTKRPERMVDILGGTSGAGLTAPPLPNLWLGTSAENQEMADQRIPHLLKVPAAKRFLSLEPLLGPVDLSPWVFGKAGYREGESGGFAMPGREPCCYMCGWRRSQHIVEQIDVRIRTNLRCPSWGPIGWIIISCESGPKRRPCKLEWVKAIVEQCDAAGVPVFVKQIRDEKNRVVHGPHEWHRWPEWARQEFPKQDE
jgi:protein gp37